MFKLILLALAVWLLITILKRYLGSVESSHQSTSVKPQDMVQCAYCGVHLPKSESLLSDDRYYCSEAHRQQRES